LLAVASTATATMAAEQKMLVVLRFMMVLPGSRV
jgi:hypothetical protein